MLKVDLHERKKFSLLSANLKHLDEMKKQNPFVIQAALEYLLNVEKVIGRFEEHSARMALRFSTLSKGQIEGIAAYLKKHRPLYLHSSRGGQSAELIRHIDTLVEQLSDLDAFGMGDGQHAVQDLHDKLGVLSLTLRRCLENPCLVGSHRHILHTMEKIVQNTLLNFDISTALTSVLMYIFHIEMHDTPDAAKIKETVTFFNDLPPYKATDYGASSDVLGFESSSLGKIYQRLKKMAQPVSHVAAAGVGAWGGVVHQLIRFSYDLDALISENLDTSQNAVLMEELHALSKMTDSRDMPKDILIPLLEGLKENRLSSKGLLSQGYFFLKAQKDHQEAAQETTDTKNPTLNKDPKTLGSYFTNMLAEHARPLIGDSLWEQCEEQLQENFARWDYSRLIHALSDYDEAQQATATMTDVPQVYQDVLEQHRQNVQAEIYRLYTKSTRVLLSISEGLLEKKIFGEKETGPSEEAAQTYLGYFAQQTSALYHLGIVGYGQEALSYAGSQIGHYAYDAFSHIAGALCTSRRSVITAEPYQAKPNPVGGTAVSRYHRLDTGTPMASAHKTALLKSYRYQALPEGFEEKLTAKTINDLMQTPRTSPCAADFLSLNTFSWVLQSSLGCAWRVCAPRAQEESPRKSVAQALGLSSSRTLRFEEDTMAEKALVFPKNAQSLRDILSPMIRAGAESAHQAIVRDLVPTMVDKTMLYACQAFGPICHELTRLEKDHHQPLSVIFQNVWKTPYQKMSAKELSEHLKRICRKQAFHATQNFISDLAQNPTILGPLSDHPNQPGSKAFIQNLMHALGATRKEQRLLLTDADQHDATEAMIALEQAYQQDHYALSILLRFLEHELRLCQNDHQSLLRQPQSDRRYTPYHAMVKALRDYILELSSIQLTVDTRSLAVLTQGLTGANIPYVKEIMRSIDPWGAEVLCATALTMLQSASKTYDIERQAYYAAPSTKALMIKEKATAHISSYDRRIEESILEDEPALSYRRTPVEHKTPSWWDNLKSAFDAAASGLGALYRRWSAGIVWFFQACLANTRDWLSFLLESLHLKKPEKHPFENGSHPIANLEKPSPVSLEQESVSPNEDSPAAQEHPQTLEAERKSEDQKPSSSPYLKPWQ